MDYKKLINESTDNNIGDMYNTFSHILAEKVINSIDARRANISSTLLEDCGCADCKCAEKKKVTCPKCDGEGCEHCDDKGYHLNEAKSFRDFDVPASPEIKKHIESGKAKILMNVQSVLGPTTRFVVVERPKMSMGSGKQDKVLMATISDPKRGRIKMFAFHGSHVSHQKAMQFAKNNKLVAKEDAKGNPLYAKESYLDEVTVRHHNKPKWLKKAQRQKLGLGGRQLKDPKKEVMVVDKKGKVIVIDRKDLKSYERKGWDIAESVQLDELRRDVYVITDKKGKVVAAKLTRDNAHKEISRHRGGTIVLDPDAKVGQVLKKFIRKESVELDEANASYQFPSNKQANQFAKDIANAGVATGTVSGNKVIDIDYLRSSGAGLTVRAIKKYMKKNHGKIVKESYQLDEDNTAAIAKQVKQAVKKYTTGKLAVQSKGGKTRFIMVRADKIDNELRKKVLNVVAPKANVRDKSDISYGNISGRIISASVDHWVKALGLKESVIQQLQTSNTSKMPVDININGSIIHITPDISENLINLHDELNEENQTKMREMLTSDSGSFVKIARFAQER